MVAPNIFGSSVQNLLHVTALTPRILQWLVDVWKLFESIAYNHTLVLRPTSLFLFFSLLNGCHLNFSEYFMPLVAYSPVCDHPNIW